MGNKLAFCPVGEFEDYNDIQDPQPPTIIEGRIASSRLSRGEEEKEAVGLEEVVRFHYFFVSYARKDLAWMKWVEKHFMSLGLNLWTDEGITPGTQNWQNSIQSAIQGAVGILVLFSPDANKSDWVKRELAYGEMWNKPIYPLLVSGEPPESIPVAYSLCQFVDIRGKDESTRLTKLQQLELEFKANGWIETPKPKPYPLERKNILWVDDNLVNGLSCVRNYRKLGASIVAVEKIHTALSLIEQEDDEFDIIISNPMAGYTLLASADERSSTPPPIILYSSSIAEIDLKRSAGSYGAADTQTGLDLLIFAALGLLMEGGDNQQDRQEPGFVMKEGVFEYL